MRNPHTPHAQAVAQNRRRAAKRAAAYVWLLVLILWSGAAGVNAIAEARKAESEARVVQETVGGGEVALVHPGQGGSPHVKVDWVVSGANVAVIYGRPYLKDRVVGESVEPFEGRVWRLGADEATTLLNEEDLRIGDTRIPAGAYTLWVLDTGTTWHLIINEETGQFGTAYDESQDLARIAMTVADVDTPTEQLTLWIEEGQFKIEWGRKIATVPLDLD